MAQGDRKFTTIPLHTVMVRITGPTDQDSAYLYSKEIKHCESDHTECRAWEKVVTDDSRDS